RYIMCLYRCNCLSAYQTIFGTNDRYNRYHDLGINGWSVRRLGRVRVQTSLRCERLGQYPAWSRWYFRSIRQLVVRLVLFICGWLHLIRKYKYSRRRTRILYGTEE